MLDSKAYQDRVLECRWLPKPLNLSRLFKEWNGGRYGYRQKGMIGAVFGLRTGGLPVQLGVDQLIGPPLEFLHKRLKSLGQPKTHEELQCDSMKSVAKVFAFLGCPFTLETTLDGLCNGLKQASIEFIQGTLLFEYSFLNFKCEEPAVFLNSGGLLYRFAFWNGLLNGVSVVDLTLVYRNSSAGSLPALEDALVNPFDLGLDWFKIA